MALSSPVSPRDLGLKEKRFQSVEEVEAAYNLIVRRMNEVYKYNRRDHDRLTEDVGDVSVGAALDCASAMITTPHTIAHSTVTTIAVNTVLYDPDGWFNTGTYKFTVPSDGLYFISCVFYVLYGAYTDTYMQVRIYAAGATVADTGSYTPSIGTSTWVNTQGLVQMTAGQTIEFRAFHLAGVGNTMDITNSGGHQVSVIKIK